MPFKVKYIEDGHMEHNWEVCDGDVVVGYVHCNGDGEEFGGSFPGADGFDSQWDKVQEQCESDLADFYLIDRMEKYGY